MRTVLALAAKDMLLELKGREVVVTLMVFALLVLALFSLALPPGFAAAGEAAPGILWVTLLFAGVLGLGRSFDRERENGCFRALLLAPLDPARIYWGKWLSTVLFLFLFQLLLWPVFAVLFGYSPAAGLPALAGLLLAGDAGFSALGVLLSAAVIHARGREVILPLMLLPLCLPLLVGGARGTALLLAGDGGGEVMLWMGRMLAFDAIFLSLGTALFPLVVEE